MAVIYVNNAFKRKSNSSEHKIHVKLVIKNILIALVLWLCYNPKQDESG